LNAGKKTAQGGEKRKPFGLAQWGGGGGKKKKKKGKRRGNSFEVLGLNTRSRHNEGAKKENEDDKFHPQNKSCLLKKNSWEAEIRTRRLMQTSFDK